MFTAFSLAVGQLSDPKVRRVVWLSLGAALVVFMLLLASIWGLIANTAFFTLLWLDTVIDVLGVAAAFILAWLLFPAVASVVIGLLLEDVAGAVEAKHYPDRPAPRDQPGSEAVLTTLKFAGITVLLNIPVLLFLIIPPVFPFVFYGVNGYLLGREYFELIALRRTDARTVQVLRKRIMMRLWPAGILIAFLMTVPVINLITPVVATAAVLHLFERWRARGLLPEVS